MTLLLINTKKMLTKLTFLTVILFCSINIFASSISGIVYDNRRNPLVEVDVELQDDFYRTIARTKTSGAGRYEFGGLRDGRFTVRVLPFRYDFMDESALVEITTITSVPGQLGNTFINQDFYLTPRKGSLTDTELGVVFAQEVPKEAEKLYENGVKELSKKKTEEGVSDLKKAITAFPDYYEALHRLGKELFLKGQYEEAAPILIKASEINTKSPTTFYYLGYSLLKLNYPKAALVSLNQAHTLAPSSIQVLYILGTAEIAESKYTDAEKHLLEAKKLSKVGVPDIHWQLAQLYGNNLKKYKEAADELELYLKAGKYEDQHIIQVKRVIADLRKKAEVQATAK